ncbi:MULTISPECIES: hypothetical protein [Salinibaculum]|uniref:hypothetical protein n=1 Tax=Salinibaculum TaxID=2732368 RepID=UPI0030CED9A7
MTEDHTEKSATVSPQTEPAPTPLISAADIPLNKFPVYDIPRGWFQALEAHAKRRVENGAYGTAPNHFTGLLGEDALARHLGISERLDTELYADGDGGVDLVYQGGTIDVKTVGRHREDPALTVDAYEPLRADYYALAHRIGPNRCRLIGYAPRHFVANAPTHRAKGDHYHHVPSDYLFPVPHFLTA